MMRSLGFFALLVMQSVASSQHVAVSVTHLEARKATLSALGGEKVRTIDTVTSSEDGGFIFDLPSASSRGAYRLSFDRGKWIDFINDGENVDIVTDAGALTDSLRVLRSESNRLYYSFRRLNQLYKTRSEILQLVLARYPHDDPYYTTTRATASELQRSYLDFVGSAVAAHPSSFIARYISSAQLPVLDLAQPLDKQLAHLKAHALDQVDFTDEGLMHSDLFTSKSIDYLMYYRNPQLPKELLAREFNSAVDSILNRAKVNQVVYRHVTEYLIDGFKQFGFEECINYILENYVIKDDLCLEGSGNTIQRMIDQKKHLPTGSVAPDFTLPDTSGRPTSLRNVMGEKFLVVFYSAACPHCQSMLPRLATLAKEKSKALTVVAVSLDANVEDWTGFIRTHGLSWMNVIDVKGWDGKTAQDYFIYATPTMFLLDSVRQIIGKPLTVEELQQLL